MTLTVTFCAGCPLGRTDVPEDLAHALARAGLAAQVRRTDCMNGCARPSTVAFRAPGKTAWLFADVTAADLPDLLTMARLVDDSPDGTIADARPLGGLRSKLLGRIPG
ncbi:MAG: DUF1636 family protein [Rubellimicrobium sp.]|nr:DUF1636 family protein [Rubellimicrobium sp.]